MAAVLFQIETLAQAIVDQRLILTANNRQRNQILNAWTQRQQRQGQPPLGGIRVLSMTQWQEQLWQRCLVHDDKLCDWLVADNWQISHLWETAIANSDSANGLLQAGQMAAMAETARASLGQWRCPPERIKEIPYSGNQSNSEVFLGWLSSFNSLLVRHRLLTREQALEHLLEHLDQGLLATESGAYLYGFDDLSPLAQALLNTALPGHNRLEETPPDNSRVVRTQAQDSEQEIRSAALWANAITQSEPGATIGIIVPELGLERRRIERLFSEVFDPLLCLPEQPRYAPALNFSAGTPLGEAPVIHTALELLALHQSSFTLERLCTLLHSPFWAGDTLAFRSALVQRLRHLGRRHIDIRELRYQSERLNQSLAATESTFSALLNSADFTRQRHQQYGFGRWRDTLAQLLAGLGWPGSRGLDSIEFQQIKQWYNLLDELGSIEQIEPALDFAQCLNLLRTAADRTHFQPQTPQSPIQILGALEGAGLHFSHLWVMGLNHRQWPPSPAPNPLLPLDLQRELGMPHASAERELDFARRLTAAYQRQAETLIFSYAAQGDGDALRPSPLIDRLPECPLTELIGVSPSHDHDNYQRLMLTRNLEAVAVDYGPPLSGTLAPGGAGLFKHQAACPFTAFARYRLNASAAEPPAIGFSAIERGIILHDALAVIWQQLGDQSHLQVLAETEREALVDKSCHEAIARVQRHRPAELLNGYCAIEKNRLSAQIARWLTLEAERPDFRVRAIEEKIEAHFAGLSLTLRVDRIDELADGRLLIIDYKTGNPSPKSWLSTRFREPQLPLYASLYQDQVAAIAFAIVNVNQQALLGWADDNACSEGLVPPAAGSWQTQQQEWHQALTDLALEFAQGYAPVIYRDPEAETYDGDIAPLTRRAERNILSQLAIASLDCEAIR